MQVQRSRDHRRAHDAGLRAPAVKYTTIVQRVRLHGILEGKNARMTFDKNANLKYKFGNRHFRAEGYYVSTVGLNEATIAKYIRDQEKYDITMD